MSKMAVGRPSVNSPEAASGKKVFVTRPEFLPTVSVSGTEYLLVNSELASALGVKKRGEMTIPFGQYGTMFNPESYNPEFMVGEIAGVPQWAVCMVLLAGGFIVRYLTCRRR